MDDIIVILFIYIYSIVYIIFAAVYFSELTNTIYILTEREGEREMERGTKNSKQTKICI